VVPFAILNATSSIVGAMMANDIFVIRGLRKTKRLYWQRATRASIGIRSIAQYLTALMQLVFFILLFGLQCHF
jgi:hypothetical protein